MSTFQALMALSATQTRESQSAVQTAIQERQRKEELRRKQQEERDRKEQEMEKKLRLKRFEDQKREEERLKRQEEARKAKEAELQRREEEQRDALRYGPKKAKTATTGGGTPKWPSSQSSNREGVRKTKIPGDEDDDDSAPEFLTREEKRERKLQQERRKLFQPTKRTTQSSAYTKSGRRLPGGAVDIATTSQSLDAGSKNQSIRERIAAMPNTLTKLNTVKRDTRTIDEIYRTGRKRKSKSSMATRPASSTIGLVLPRKKNKRRSHPPPPPLFHRHLAQILLLPVSIRTDICQLVPLTMISEGSNYAATSSQKKTTKPSNPKPISTKPSASSSAGPKSATSATRPNGSDKYAKPSNIPSAKISKISASAPPRNNGSFSKKRTRSPSRSPTPPPYKKRALSPELTNDISSTIWQMFGKKRDNYVGMDVLSDDEDMEADATLLEREEMLSARIAKREEEQAIEEERRHEEEKRRRKKDKEARDRRGGN
ncbi:hypothetical protein BD779DRAFT_593512 [Infundibulicybe gibba]|nr:hypothetical protein BD779DRAFT_593512 [Infundibulicybe gibba]